MLNSTLAYDLLISAVAAERLVELWLSLRNGRWAKAQGGLEYGTGHYRWMVALHSALLLACLGEVHWLHRPFIAALGWPMLGLVGLTMTLRYWAILTLGRCWNTRIIVVPGLPAVAGGPYRWLRHPNYVAVIIEVAALPLVHTAWCTSLAFSLANALLLRTRIGVEEQALRQHNDYAAHFQALPRLWPSLTAPPESPR